MSWECRTDALDGELGRRWGHVVRFGDKPLPGEVAFLGFASDEGVRRNQGRVGAKDGPHALRLAMANLAYHREIGLLDLGDVVVESSDLESARSCFATRGSVALSEGAKLFGLGGGHEIAYASLSALRRAEPSARIGILYFDAHFDLRRADQPTSGTPFREFLSENPGTKALVVGINPASNTPALFESAQELGVRFVKDEDMRHASTDDVLCGLLEGVDVLYMSFDLDVLPASVACGVSAPNGWGVEYAHLRLWLESAAKCGKMRVFDIAELNPSEDKDNRTARVAARIAWDVVQWWT